MRVLHLIDGGFRGGGTGPEAENAALACRLLLERSACQNRVCVLGPRSAVRAATCLGLKVDGAIAPGLGLPEMGWRALRHLMNAWGRPDIVQAWGVRAARLALRASGDSISRVAVLPEGDGAPADVAITFSQSASTRLLESGADVGRIVVAPAPVWTADTGAREQIRSELGAGAGEVLIAQLGVAPRADGLRLLFLMGLLREGGAPVRGVMRAGVNGRLRAMVFGRSVGSTWVGVSERPMRQLLGACDLAIFDGGGPGPTKDWDEAPWAAVPWIAPAMAAGVPVVAPDWALRELGEIPGCAVYNSTLPELARGLIGLAESPDLRAEAAARGRELMGGASAGEGFVRAVVETWEETLAQRAHDG